MWSDSLTVLQWLTSLEKQPTFVANRVCETLDLTTVDEWHHVPTAHNTADAGTRGISATALLNSCWLSGPYFLKTSDLPFKLPDNFRQKVKKTIALIPLKLSKPKNISVLHILQQQPKLQQLSSGRSTVLTKNFCALWLTCCNSSPRTNPSALTLDLLQIQLISTTPNRDCSIWYNSCPLTLKRNAC